MSEETTETMTARCRRLLVENAEGRMPPDYDDTWLDDPVLIGDRLVRFGDLTSGDFQEWTKIERAQAAEEYVNRIHSRS